MIPAAGERVGPYEILGRLGSGGMGLVFSAWDSRLHRDVAIKLLREDYTSSESRERFLMEARAASGLNHPHICTIFDIGEQDGNPYLVMELLKGETLRARITSGVSSPEEILRTGIEVAEALNAAHARGIIHRDIKPANIFLVARPGGGEQAKVLDFGLAKIDIGDGFDPGFEMTGAGATVGTVSYMSPEQARGEALDARSDLFALGVVLYEMATGNVPFQGATSALIFVQLLSQTPQKIREINPDIPKDLERIILKLLAKDRTERFQSASELLSALRKVVVKKPSALSGLFNRRAHGQSSNSGNDRARGSDPNNISPVEPTSPKRTSPPLASVIRPVRREPLPPTESGSGKHGSQAAAVSEFDPPSKRSSSSESSLTESSSTHSSVSRRTANFSYEETPVEEVPIVEEPEPTSRSHWQLWLPIGVAVLLVGVVVWSIQSSPAVIKGPAKLMLASVANHSGDKMLDGVVLEGLRFDLAQSPNLTLIQSAAEAAGLPVLEAGSISDARTAAVSVGATAFLFGEITKDTGPYVVNLGIYSVESGKPVTQAEETSDSREQIGDVIDRLSAQIRMGLGESADSFARTSAPLARDATSNIEALQSYVAGSSAEASGHPLEAMAAFQRAVTVEPKFTQAWIRLASIYRAQRAESAAADAAVHAQDASVGTSDRTKLLAEWCYALNTTGDYSHALALLDQLTKSYPLDTSIAAQRAQVLRLQGRFSEAIAVAQSALTQNPYDRKASLQMEYAMLALDRGQAAFERESQAEQRGQRHPELHLLLAFLNDTPGSTSAFAQEVEPDQLRGQAFRAQILDATGQLTDGLSAWHTTSNAAKGYPALVSTAAYALSQAALNRALASDCATATALAREASTMPRGENAIFSIGMAQGLCGDLSASRDAIDMLTSHYPQSFAVKNYYLAELLAIDQIRSGDSDAAVVTLQDAKQYDLISLTPYLRGLAHAGSKDWPNAISDFQFVLLHRGAITLTGATVYPMSQLALARAYSATGDPANSVAAYKSFSEMWSAAPKDSLLVEAGQHLR